MSPFTITAIDFFDQLTLLVEQHSQWSQATFGTDAERGPIGPLKHLALEAIEAAEAFEKEEPAEICDEELADCLLLFLDATRRSKRKLITVIKAAQKKLDKNKLRTWPQFDPSKSKESIHAT